MIQEKSITWQESSLGKDLQNWPISRKGVFKLLEECKKFPLFSLLGLILFLVSTTRCTVVSSGLMEYHERLFYCKTCAIPNICKGCSEICHLDHNLSPVPGGEAVCSCGSSTFCLIKRTPPIRLQCKSHNQKRSFVNGIL